MEPLSAAAGVVQLANFSWTLLRFVINILQAYPHVSEAVAALVEETEMTWQTVRQVTDLESSWESGSEDAYGSTNLRTRELLQMFVYPIMPTVYH